VDQKIARQITKNGSFTTIVVAKLDLIHFFQWFVCGKGRTKVSIPKSDKVRKLKLYLLILHLDIKYSTTYSIIALGVQLIYFIYRVLFFIVINFISFV